MSEYQYYDRLPQSLLDTEAAEQYCVGDQVTAWTSGNHLIVDLTSEDDAGEWEEDAEGSLSAIVGVRDELAAGDLRPLYVAWLAGQRSARYRGHSKPRARGRGR